MLGLAINLLGIKKAIGSAFSWATANATRMLAIALALALAWGAIERHGKHKAQKVLASTETAYNRQVVAHGQTVISLRALTAAVEKQTAMVRAWSARSTDRQNAAQAALRDATARGKLSEAHALRIDAERTQRGSGGQCASGEAVMAARGEL